VWGKPRTILEEIKLGLNPGCRIGSGGINGRRWQLIQKGEFGFQDLRFKREGRV
jgi:hypothetical protein